MLHWQSARCGGGITACKLALHLRHSEPYILLMHSWGKGTNSSSGGWQPSVRSNSDTPSSAGSIAIAPKDVEICHHSDGRAWVLGAGNFGKVISWQLSAR